MGQTPFLRPVVLERGRGGRFEARTPLEALDYLRRHWPGGRTAHYRWALALCDAAARGRANAEEARRALLDAAQRTGVLVARASSRPAPDAAASIERGWQGPGDADRARSDFGPVAQRPLRAAAAAGQPRAGTAVRLAQSRGEPA